MRVRVRVRVRVRATTRARVRARARVTARWGEEARRGAVVRCHRGGGAERRVRRSDLRCHLGGDRARLRGDLARLRGRWRLGRHRTRDAAAPTARTATELLAQADRRRRLRRLRPRLLPPVRRCALDLRRSLAASGHARLAPLARRLCRGALPCALRCGALRCGGLGGGHLLGHGPRGLPRKRVVVVQVALRRVAADPRVRRTTLARRRRLARRRLGRLLLRGRRLRRLGLAALLHLVRVRVRVRGRVRGRVRVCPLLHPRLHWRGHLCRRLGLHRGVITSGLHAPLGRRRGRRAEEVGGRRRRRVHAGRRRLRRRLRWRLVPIARRWGRALLREGGRAEVLLVRGRVGVGLGLGVG